jgi:cytochrome c2
VNTVVRCAAALALAVALAGPAAGRAAAQPSGDASRGEQVFASKQCAHCHRPDEPKGIGPRLDELRRPQGAYELAGRLWNHAPAMFTALKVEGLAWPVIDEGEMLHLMAYLRADAARDPSPEPRRGQLILVAKGCLKCHRFQGEGANVAGDLAERRKDYAPPERWASKVWSHTPRIAQKAIERGVPYPRFTGDEMAHLIGFLRTGGAGR